MFCQQYIPSTTDGKCFHVYVYKPTFRNGPARAIAVEGEMSHGGECFMQPWNSRQTHIDLKGNNTPKNRAIALQALFTELVAHDWIKADEIL